MLTIAGELARFKDLKAKLIIHGLAKELGEYALVVHGGALPLPAGIQYGASITALTHGNEVGGAAVVNELLQLILAETVGLPFAVFFSLNNPKAGLADLRFIDQDLNRCLGAVEVPPEQKDGLERKLAPSIAEHLRAAYCALDLHQTQLNLPLNSSFWPALDLEEAVKAIKVIDPLAVIVTTPPTAPEARRLGMSCDNFMHHLGRLGITIELGARGFDSYQISRGVHVALSFISYVKSNLLKKKTEAPFHGKLFETIEVVRQKVGAMLRSDLKSFLALKAGETYGTWGDGSPMVAKQDCFVLFPKVAGKVAYDSREPLCYLIV